VKAELNDGAFPLLEDVVTTSDPSIGFKDIDYAFMIGAKPRGPGMERADLLKDNGKIFVGTGKALSDYAKRTCKTIVVGNPANTNCLILQKYSKGIPAENFTAMTRLDHNRALT
jgi:malate/lactate dehydrogenase